MASAARPLTSAAAFNSAAVAVRLSDPSFRVPYVTVTVVVILEIQLSIAPKPDVIEPEFNAPVVTKLDIAVISSS